MDDVGPGGGAALVSHVVGSSKRSRFAAVSRWTTGCVCKGKQRGQSWESQAISGPEWLAVKDGDLSDEQSRRGEVSEVQRDPTRWQHATQPGLGVNGPTVLWGSRLR
jgi:hypothetical protein